MPTEKEVNDANREVLRRAMEAMKTAETTEEEDLTYDQKCTLLERMDLTFLVNTHPEHPYPRTLVNWLIPSVIMDNNPKQRLAMQLALSKNIIFANADDIRRFIVKFQNIDLFTGPINDLSNVYRIGLSMSYPTISHDALPYLPESDDPSWRIPLSEKRAVIDNMIMSIEKNKIPVRNILSQRDPTPKIQLDINTNSSNPISVTINNVNELESNQFLDSLKRGLIIHRSMLEKPSARPSFFSNRTSNSHLTFEHSHSESTHRRSILNVFQRTQRTKSESSPEPDSPSPIKKSTSGNKRDSFPSPSNLS